MNRRVLSTGTDDKKYASDVVSAISEAYYSRGTLSPDSARARAFSSQGIASAVVASLLAATFVINLRAVPAWVQTIGAAALAAWLGATGLYVYAVAAPVKLETSDQVGPDAFVREVVKNARTERQEIERRQKYAIILSTIALVLTAATLAAAVLAGTVEKTFPATVYLTPARGDGVMVCGEMVQQISGEVYEASLQTRLLGVRPTGQICPNNVAAVYVPANSVAHIERTR